MSCGPWLTSTSAKENADLFRLAACFHSGFVEMCEVAKPFAPSALAPRLATLATAVGFSELKVGQKS